jgi:hypothetical protein
MPRGRVKGYKTSTKSILQLCDSCKMPHIGNECPTAAVGDDFNNTLAEFMNISQANKSRSHTLPDTNTTPQASTSASVTTPTLPDCQEPAISHTEAAGSTSTRNKKPLKKKRRYEER